LSFVQGRELCSDGIISVSHCACAKLKKCNGRGLSDDRQQSTVRRRAQSRCLDFSYRGGRIRARSLPHHGQRRSGAPYPKPQGPFISCRQSNCPNNPQSPSPLLLCSTLHSYWNTAHSHCQPHHSHITANSTMADKFPSVEDLDSGIPLQSNHHSPNTS